LYSDVADGQDDDEAYDGLEEEELLSMVTVLQNEMARKAERKKGKMQFAGVEIPARKAPAKPAAKTTDVRPATEGESAAKSPGASGSSGKGKGIAGQADAGPQYRYQSPIENAEAARRIMDLLMEQQITVSQKDLLAAMPELRKSFKEQVSGKRIPVGSATVYDQAEVYMSNYTRLADGTVVGRDQVPLRCVTAMVNDSEHIECLLDNGSSIIVMHVDIWRRLGLPLSDEVMVMETANSARDPTMGRLKNVRFSFQGLEVMLQVQVVRNSPCEVLLGRPFFTLTTCITRDFMDGNQHITISDPNGGGTVTIPTRTRLRGPPGSEDRTADSTLVAMADADVSVKREGTMSERPAKRPRLDAALGSEIGTVDPNMPNLEESSSDDELVYPDDWDESPSHGCSDSAAGKATISGPTPVDNIALKAVLTAGLLMGTPYPWDNVAPEARRYFHMDRFSVMEEDANSFLVIDHVTGANYHIDPRKVDNDGFEARDWLIGEHDESRGGGPDFGLADLFSREGSSATGSPCSNCQQTPHGLALCSSRHPTTPTSPMSSITASSGRSRWIVDLRSSPADTVTTGEQEVIDLTGSGEVIDLTGGSDEEAETSEAFF
jgi:hypothetical protein